MNRQEFEEYIDKKYGSKVSPETRKMWWDMMVEAWENASTPNDREYWSECSMCGKEMAHRPCGMCAKCEQVWNG